MRGHAIDKSGWMVGPWMTEPDFEEFNYGGLLCCIIRAGFSGCINGYVLIPNNIVGSINIEDLRCHGGITYTHAKLPDLTDTAEGTWIGFDTAHHSDLLPAISKNFMATNTTYRDIDYVRQQIKSLVHQIKHVAFT